MTIKQIIRENIVKILSESIVKLTPEAALVMILKSIPGLKSFEPTDENINMVAQAKENNIGFWLFAEWIMKQHDPMGEAMRLSYIGNEKVLASYRIDDLDGTKVLWFSDVQSLEKGGFKTIFNKIIDIAKNMGLKYIAGVAYTPEVKSMYFDRFGFEPYDGCVIIKKV